MLSIRSVFIWGGPTIFQGIGEKICKDLSSETEIDKDRQFPSRGKAHRFDDLNPLIRQSLPIVLELLQEDSRSGRHGDRCSHPPALPEIASYWDPI
jgi:hypothetical protein